MKTRPVRTISREVGRLHPGVVLTPQRLHAELLDAGAKDLEAYLQGALKDGTRSALHRTHRIGQKERAWLDILRAALGALGHRSWVYREGKQRDYWVLETCAQFLSVEYDGSELIGTREGLFYAKGFFDAEGGMPKDPGARLYLQFCQKSRGCLVGLRSILESSGIQCGRLHNPSRSADPHYWRFYVLAGSHERFMHLVGSWHPRKRLQIETRMKI